MVPTSFLAGIQVVVLKPGLAACVVIAVDIVSYSVFFQQLSASCVLHGPVMFAYPQVSYITAPNEAPRLQVQLAGQALSESSVSHGFSDKDSRARRTTCLPRLCPRASPERPQSLFRT